MTEASSPPKSRLHHYATSTLWTGNLGSGTSSYRAYSREHEISAPGKATLQASADPAFRGDPALYNPEDLFLASLSSCHMLWYLALCAQAGVTVTDYRDEARGEMEELPVGSGRFTEVTLRPTVTITADSDPDKATELHHQAHDNCYIANSVSVPVRCEPTIVRAAP